MPQAPSHILYQQFTEPVLAQPERVSEDKWHQPWSLPVWSHKITTAEIASGGVLVQAIFAEEITADKWFHPLSERLYPKKGIGAHLQQFTTLNPFGMTQPERVSEDKWHQPWSLPVWHKLYVLSGQQEPIFVPHAPTVPFSWFETLSEPVRQKPRLRESAQPFFAYGRPPLVSFGWFDGLSEPVRIKPALRVALQRFEEFVEAIFGETIFPDKWYQQWQNPVWRKASLDSGLHEVLAQVITPHQIYLAAIETPDVMAASLLRFVELLGANVSVIEITPQFANMSSAIEPSVFANVAIVEV